MSVVGKPQPAYLFTAVLFSKGVDPNSFLGLLSSKIGEFLISSRVMDFVWSDYYEKEMGKDLKRIFVVYKDFVQRDKIVAVKRLTDEMEKLYVKNGKRTVNIDPGLVCMENLILATNKSFFQRIYLNDGVYAEVTLFYRNNTYNPVEYWTYPEYRSTPVLEFFNGIRDTLSRNIQGSINKF